MFKNTIIKGFKKNKTLFNISNNIPSIVKKYLMISGIVGGITFGIGTKFMVDKIFNKNSDADILVSLFLSYRRTILLSIVVGMFWPLTFIGLAGHTYKAIKNKNHIVDNEKMKDLFVFIYKK